MPGMQVAQSLSRARDVQFVNVPFGQRCSVARVVPARQYDPVGHGAGSTVARSQ